MNLPEAAAVPAARAALIVADIIGFDGVDDRGLRGCNLLGHLSDAAVPELFSRPELRRIEGRLWRGSCLSCGWSETRLRADEAVRHPLRLI